MTKIPVIPETAPFDAMQRMWLNGFLAGLFSSEPTAIAVSAATSSSLGPLLFLFGSQTEPPRDSHDASRRKPRSLALRRASSEWRAIRPPILLRKSV